MQDRRLFLAALVALLVGLVAACSGSTAYPISEGGDRSAVDAAGLAGVPEAAVPTGAPANNNSDFPNNSNPISEQQQLIVYNGSLDLEVAEIDAAVAQPEALIKGLGGHVAASRASDTGNGKSAYVTYRIPAERWTDALDGLKGLATRVANEETSSDDVTAQVVDLNARLTNLRSTEAALQGIMTRANTITDVLKVQSELTQVRGEIESLTAQRDLLANQAALATLQVGFNVLVAEVAQASANWDLGKEIDSALAALVRLGQGLVSVLVVLVIVVVPVVVPVVIAIWVISRLWLHWRRTHPAAAPSAAASGQ